MLVNIIALRDEQRPIQAIKELRAVTGLGLKEAKDIIDAVRSLNGAVRVRVSINDGTLLSNLDWLIVEPVAQPSVPRDLCLDFLLDVLSNASAGDAATLRTKASYLAFLEAVR